ncbi:MAG: DUF4965 domain-containing protein [Bacteroidia bacterium]|nr:DUF4965 domain-containing protein [Bacteroidia bacterium]
MKKSALFILLFLVSGAASFSQQFRPPSVPLVAHDPYFSIWSPANNLYDSETVHWTGKEQPMHSIVRIDGKAYRLMGSQPTEMETVKQTSVNVFPTHTVYSFQNESVKIQLVFTTPALVSKLDVLSRPVTYLTWNIKSVDGKSHEVQLYFDCGGEVVVNTPDQNLQWDSPVIGGLQTLRIWNPDQPVLQKKGDNLRIDWGYAYLSVTENQKSQTKVGGRENLMKSFISSGDLASVSTLPQPRKANDEKASMAVTWNVGKVNSTESTCWAMLGYDDQYGIRYFDTNLKAWWKRDGMTMNQLLPLAAKEYTSLQTECAAFDADLLKDLESVGGKKYAVMNALVYRQCLAAHKLVADAKGMPLIFSKENFSNGCIATVDVIYPASPFFFLFSPALTKAMLQPNFDYAASARWKFPFAPHDLGTYPHATGQAYGGGEETEENQMPVEETGNMIIMTSVLAKMEGNAAYAQANWPVIEKWSDYLLSKGFDPENQLCTDDFAGHLAHNINLSAKAIVALGSYAMLCELTGRKDKASEVRTKAEAMAKDWVTQATEGDYTKLAYDRSGTWSQKYNLVWDKILGLNLFPNDMVQREIEFYKKQQSTFGLPLDSRKRYTKNDWITWTATMADKQEDFKTLFDPIYHFAETTPQRVPLSDWYDTDNAKMIGFQARSVVGGFFIKMLSDKKIWGKWVAKGTNVSGFWAPLKIIVLNSKSIRPTSLQKGIVWKYTTEKPAANWFETAFADNSWNSGEAGFGSKDISIARTPWKSSDIWIRQTFEIKEVSAKKLGILIRHDEDAEIYINGKLCGSVTGYTGKYESVLPDKTVKEVLHSGENTIAIHCHQTVGGQFIDAGLFEY